MRFLMAGVSAPSHIFPSLAVIAELVDRGHEVTYVVGERLRALVEPTGATVVGTETIMPGADDPWPEDAGEAMQVFLDDAIATLPTIEGLEPAEAVLYDIGGFAGHVAAHRWGVPAVQLSPASVAWEGFEDDMAEFYRALKASASGSSVLRHGAQGGSMHTGWRWTLDATSSVARRRASCSSRKRSSPTRTA